MSLRRFASEKPTVFRFRYEREDGQYREITVSVGRGRFKRGRKSEALEIAERRLSEQYGEALFVLEAQKREENALFIDPAAELVRLSPGLHQDNYKLVSVKEVV